VRTNGQQHSPSAGPSRSDDLSHEILSNPRTRVNDERLAAADRRCSAFATYDFVEEATPRRRLALRPQPLVRHPIPSGATQMVRRSFPMASHRRALAAGDRGRSDCIDLRRPGIQQGCDAMPQQVRPLRERFSSDGNNKDWPVAAPNDRQGKRRFRPATISPNIGRLEFLRRFGPSTSSNPTQAGWERRQGWGP